MDHCNKTLGVKTVWGIPFNVVSTSSKLALKASRAFPSSAVSSGFFDLILTVSVCALFISRAKFASSGASVLVSLYGGMISVKSRDGSGSLSAYLNKIRFPESCTGIVRDQLQEVPII